jgi:cytidylate kinase
MRTRKEENKGPVIAIDGPSGTGKSTIAIRLAARLNCRYIDTGAMYRAVAILAKNRCVEIDHSAGLVELLHEFPLEYRESDGLQRVFLAGEDITDALRMPGVGEDASRLSRFPEVRKILVEKQRELARDGAVVMEGRDIGSVVLPDADLKIFLDADEEVRARRRMLQWEKKGLNASAEELKKDIRVRDRRDSTRKEAPLVLADGGVRVDTTQKSIQEVEEEILYLLPEKNR